MARGDKTARARELAEAYAAGIAKGLGIKSFIPPTVRMQHGDRIIDAMRTYAKGADGKLLTGEAATQWLTDAAEEFALNANRRAASGGYKPYHFADYLNEIEVKRTRVPTFIVALSREFIDAIRVAWRRAGNADERLIDASDRETMLIVRQYAREAAEASPVWRRCTDAELALIVEFWLVKLFCTSDEFLISQGYPLKGLLWSDCSRMKAYGVPARLGKRASAEKPKQSSIDLQSDEARNGIALLREAGFLTPKRTEKVDD